MRLAVPTLFCVVGLMLQGSDAGAETWTVLRGKLIKGGVARALSGTLSGSASAPADDSSPLLVTFDDFDLTAGKRDLLPRADIEYHGLHPIGYVTAADQIQTEGDQVTFVHLRTGGTLVDEMPGAVTFRFLELRADASHGGFVQGRLPEPDPDAPRRLTLKGDVYEVEQSFRLPDLSCAPPISSPLPGSGGGAAGGSVTVISSGATSAATVTSNPVAPLATAPTLEQLGIRAPDGAEITFEAGALRVSSTGDLFVEGRLSPVEVPGLMSVTLYTRARIVVTGSIVVPGGSIYLDAAELYWGGEIDAGNPAAQPPACQGLTPILPSADRLVGRFSLVASAARQIQIDVTPDRKRNFVLPGRQSMLAVAILGSRTLDVGDVDPETLRLGSGEAEPLGPVDLGSSFPTDPVYLQPVPVVRPINRDRFFDLLAFFRSNDAEIAFGDRELCLAAQTYEGELLEGCDRIDTGF